MPDLQRSQAIPALVLGTLVLASLGVSLTGGFVWDDAPLIVDNPRIQDPGELGKVLTSSFWETGDRHDRFRSFFRPLVSLSYAADYAIWGLRPLGFHLTNLLLHFLCCWLIYRIALREPLPAAAALTGAALFAVHPVHVESVAWISGRTDLLCALFVLGAFLVQRGAADRPGRARQGLCLILFALALFSKEMAATLPLLVFGDRWLAARGRPGPRGKALSATWPYLVVLALYLVARHLVLGAAAPPLYDLGPLAWAASAVFVLARYVTLLLIPLGLDAHYPYAPLSGAAQPLFLVSLAMLGVLAAGVRRLARSSPRGAFWVVWIFVTLTPVLALGRFGDVLLADRFLYLPSVGLAMLAGRATIWVAESATPAFWRRALAVAGGLLLVLMAVQSVRRSAAWRDDHTLFSDMLRTSPTSALVRNNFGLALYGRGEYGRAIEEFRLATELAEGYALAHNNLAAALEREGALREALVEYGAALKSSPGLMEATANGGNLMIRLGRPREGFAMLEEAVRENPSAAPALYSMAAALEFTGRDEEALPFLERAMRVDPRHAESRYLVGKIRYEQGRLPEAADAMGRFLDLWDGGEGEHTAAARRVLREANPA